MPFDLLPVPDGAVADVRPSVLHGELRRRDDDRLTADAGEHLPASCVDDRNRVRCAGRESVQRRDSRETGTPRERERAGGDQPHPQPGEASRADADRDPLDLGVLDAAAAQERVEVPQNTVTGLRVSPPSTSPSQTSALVARSVAVSNARISIP